MAAGPFLDLTPTPLNLTSLRREFRAYALGERGLKPRTTDDILAVLRRLCNFASSQDSSVLATPLIKAFLQHGRLELGWSAKTFRLYRQYLKTYCDWCVGSDYLDTNPVEPIEKPRLPHRHPRCLSSDEAQKVLFRAGSAHAGSELLRTRREAIIATFLMTGIRRAELLNLQCRDLDFKTATLIVRSGKGNKDRTVPLYPRLIPILIRYLEQKRVNGKESPWLFSSSKSDKPLTAKNLYAILKQVVEASGIKFTPHMLRHTFGRELVEADFNIYKLKELMGHSNVTTTQAYVALSPQSIKRSFEKTEIY